VIAARTFADGAIYVWHDAEGVTHYVDRLDNVPAEHRAAATLLVKDWERAAPPAEDVAPPPVAPAAPIAEPVSQVAIGSFEEGVWAGRESALAAPPPVYVSLGPIVQNVEVLAPSPLIPVYPVFGPAFPRRRHSRHVLVPSDRGPFIFGPAGPPPLGAAGPPPIGAAGAPPVRFLGH